MNKYIIRGKLLYVRGTGEELGDEFLGIALEGEPDTATILSDYVQNLVGWNEAKSVTARYYTSDTAKTREELDDALIREMSGALEADYGARYSEVTGYLWTDDDLRVGGHDLKEELKDHVGEYLHLEIEVHA